MRTVLSEIVGNDKTQLYNSDFSGVFNKSEVEKEGECYFVTRFLSFGDYDNSCDVERSNVRMFLKEFKDSKWIKHWRGAYNSECVMIDVLCDDEDIIETLIALENYPCINDEDVCLMRFEMEQEDWESWIKSDFKDKIVKHYKADYENIDDEKLWQLYNQLQEKSNCYYEIQMGGNGWIDLDALIDELPEEPLEWFNLEFWD